MAELRAETTSAKADAEQPLAERDLDILRLVAQGKSNQEIAGHLALSEKTVRNRLSLVFRQLHLKNRTEAALYAMRRGLVEPPDPGAEGNI
jgi:DNA-binding NarL/FixJ family response regulator